MQINYVHFVYFLQEYVTSQNHRTTLGGLQGGEKYLIQVNTVTSKGDSPFSGSMVITTNEITLTQTQKMKNTLGINALEVSANFTHEESLAFKNRLSVLEEKINDQNTKIADNNAEFSQNKAKIGKNKETIDKIKVNINSNEAKLTGHGGRIAINEENIEKALLGTFTKCNKKWCLQKGLTKSQYTKCESVTNQGKTCNNPEIKYGSTTGGLPRHYSNYASTYDKWCQQLGGMYSNHTLGTRTGYCVFWYTGGDEPAAKWNDCQGRRSKSKWYNGSLDEHQTSSDFITSITCN